MRSSARLLPAVLACAAALAACGAQPSGDASAAGDPASPATSSPQDAAAAEPTTGIADDFPLSAGMGGPQDTIATSRTGTGLRDLELCGTSPLRGLGTRDRMVADNSGGEALSTRELVLLGSPDEAAALAGLVADLAAHCDRSRTTSGGSTMETTNEVRESPFGDAPDAVVVQGYAFDGEPGPGHLVVHVVRAGAALLVTQTYGEWADVSEGVDQTAATLAEAVEAMDVFSSDDEPSTTPSSTASPEASSTIPDDFPLLAGWPESPETDGDGRVGPIRSDEGLRFTICGERWREPAHADRLRAGWDSAEDYRTRVLTTYDDEAGARAMVEGLVAEMQSCPSEPADDDGFGVEREVRPVTLGDEAWAILERDTFDGRPSIFGGSTAVVRVGRAVLVVIHQGHAGYPDGDGQGQVEAMGSQAATSIAKMCQFTRTGCK